MPYPLDIVSMEQENRSLREHIRKLQLELRQYRYTPVINKPITDGEINPYTTMHYMVGEATLRASWKVKDARYMNIGNNNPNSCVLVQGNFFDNNMSIGYLLDKNQILNPAQGGKVLGDLHKSLIMEIKRQIKEKNENSSYK